MDCLNQPVVNHIVEDWKLWYMSQDVPGCDFVSNMMSFAFTMMNSCIYIDDFASTMMIFAFKMMNSCVYIDDCVSN